MAEKVLPIPVFLPAPFKRALVARARALGLKETEAAAQILQMALRSDVSDENEVDQAEAERELLRVTEEVARAKLVDGWDEHLTLAVFEVIRERHEGLYSRAVSNGRTDAVNRRVGRRVKEAVGAEVKTRDGRQVTMNVPRSLPALIRRYSLLVPKTSEGT